MIDELTFAIYFTDSKKYNPALRGFFQNNGVDLYYEDQLFRLLCKVLVSHPQMLIVDNIPDDFVYKFSEIFVEDSPFFVPCVCFFIEGEMLVLKHSLPENCFVCNKLKYETKILEKINRLKTAKKANVEDKCFPVDRFDNITKTLRDVGINVRSSGSIFLKDCINQVLIDGCKACTLYNSVYSIVANKHNTTINNLERCMRTSINAAWNSKKSSEKFKNNKYIFEAKPTVKEFIYYISNCVNDLEYSQKMYTVANGVLKRNVA